MGSGPCSGSTPPGCAGGSGGRPGNCRRAGRDAAAPETAAAVACARLARRSSLICRWLLSGRGGCCVGSVCARCPPAKPCAARSFASAPPNATARQGCSTAADTDAARWPGLGRADRCRDEAAAPTRLALGDTGAELARPAISATTLPSTLAELSPLLRLPARPVLPRFCDRPVAWAAACKSLAAPFCSGGRAREGG